MIRTVLGSAKARLRAAALDVMCKQLMAGGTTGGRTPFDFHELKLLREALLSQNLCCIDGQMVSALERKFAFAYGAPYAVASTSGTAAIHVALGALDLNPGDEIITAPITDMGTIIPIISQGCIPVFADIDHTMNMDPQAVERCITPRTKAIIAVHLFGNPCDMEAMAAVAKRHDIRLIEDCAQAHWTEYRGRMLGTIGDIGCFSFQQSKHMTTGDGGMTITSNPAYYERMKLFADKGFARQAWGSRAYLFHAPNYRMTELVGAVGLAQLAKVEGVVARRRALGERLNAKLAGIEGIEIPPVTPGGRHSFWLYPLRVTGVSAPDLAAEMVRGRIWVSAGYTGKPIYLCSESLTSKKTYGTSEWPFNTNPGTTYEYKEGLCPVAEATLNELVCIPLEEFRTNEYVDRVAGLVADGMKKLSGGTVAAAAVAPAADQARPAAARPSPRTSRPSTGSKSKVRVGIIGCGQMGRWHLDSYKSDPRVELVGFVDTAIERADAFAKEVGGRGYTSHTEMLADTSLDAVSVCTIPSSHRDIVIELLNAGVHVLCEKPLAISVAQAEEMSSVARQRNRLLFTAFKFRFHDEVRRAKELIDAGSLGKILNFRLMFGGRIDMKGQWYANKALAGGGIIMDNGPHAADLMQFLFGHIKSITAQAGTFQGLEVEDTAKLDVCMANEAVGTGDTELVSADSAALVLEIYGEDGAASLDAEGISYRFKTWSEWKRTANQVDVKGAFARQIHYFIDAVGGQNPLGLGNDEGVASQRVIAAAYESIEQDRKVIIPAAREAVSADAREAVGASV